MAFGGFNDNKQNAPMADINVTPMVDVMLVLLVIFIITAPLFTHAIKLDLPNAQSTAAPAKPDTISLSINGEGIIFTSSAQNWSWVQNSSQASQTTRKIVTARRRQSGRNQFRSFCLSAIGPPWINSVRQML